MRSELGLFFRLDSVRNSGVSSVEFTFVLGNPMVSFRVLTQGVARVFGQHYSQPPFPPMS